MKRRILLLTLNTLFIINNSNAQGTATWNGSVSADWSNASNWTWVNGNGIPGPNDDVIIKNASNTANNARIPPHFSANCKKLQLGLVNGDFVTLKIDDSATLNVYGNINRAYDGSIISSNYEDMSTTLNLLGIGDQMLTQTELTIGNINVNKPSGDVYLSTATDESIVNIANSLNFLNQPVPVGSDPSGNLYMNSTAIVFYVQNPEAKITTTTYQDNETPPHLITNSNYSAIWFYHDFTGNKFIPISPYITSFNPITIHSNAESWYIRGWGPPENACNSFYSVANAVRRTWIIGPTTYMGIKTPSNHPASVSMTFQVNNVGRDVPANFNPNNNSLDIWRNDRLTHCWERIGSAQLPTTGYITVTTPLMSKFNEFAIAPDTTTHETAISPELNSMSNISLYPNPVSDHLTLNLNEHTGKAITVDILDLFGKVVLSEKLSNGNYEINTARLIPGIYTIRFSDKEAVVCRKLIKR